MFNKYWIMFEILVCKKEAERFWEYTKSYKGDLQ